MYVVSGEYVSLYQTQRSLLRERSAEKDEYIWRLAREREELGDKLAQLQAAVVTLLAERNQLHQYPTRPSQEREGSAEAENTSAAPPVANGATGDFGKLSNSQLEGRRQFQHPLVLDVMTDIYSSNHDFPYRAKSNCTLL